ncbi:hypothetical protein JCM3765_001909 [Sporobolomyces pararoseus]
MPSPRSPSSTGHQDEVPTVGSPGDIKQRIRAFYGFWLGKMEDIAGAGEIALEPDSIEVRQSLLSFEDQTRYNAGELYDASGFVRRSFFDHRYSEPWSTQDPTPHLPALPAPQHRVTFQLCRRSTAPEQNGPLQLRAEATCPPWLEPPRDGSGNSGQGSNHRGPLNLNGYHKQLAPSPSPRDSRRDPPPHPPSHTLSHRQRFNYRQSFAAGNL